MLSTELIVIVTDASGRTKTLDSRAPDAADRPIGVSFSSQLMSGFYTASFTLARRIDEENTDVHLGDDVKIILANGDTLYEGYVVEVPRSTGADGHTLTVTAAGWMGHTSDEPFTMIFVDRDLSKWGPSSVQRRVTAGNFPIVEGPTVAPDSSGNPSVVLQLNRFANPGLQREQATALYQAPAGTQIASLYYDVSAAGLTGSWNYDIQLASDDTFTAVSASTADLSPGPSTGTLVAGSTPAAVAEAHFYFDGNGPFDGPWISYLRRFAVYGDHGLTLIGSTNPQGVGASDVIKWIAGRYCPKLNTSGVLTTTYPIAHLVFDQPTTPYDAFLKVNSYHQWNLAVWEDRTLHFEPIDLTDWDWEVRHDEVGQQIGLQGDTFTNLRNGIIVHFTNAATGLTETLHPDDYMILRDESIDNPLNQHGRRGYGNPFTVPFPTTEGNALELGRIKLLEDNQPKGLGSFTVENQIKDRQGNWQPVAKVRAGDRVRLTSSADLSDRPRLIGEVQYSDDSKTATIAVDGTMQALDAFFDRMSTALLAEGLTS